MNDLSQLRQKMGFGRSGLFSGGIASVLGSSSLQEQQAAMGASSPYMMGASSPYIQSAPPVMITLSAGDGLLSRTLMAARKNLWRIWAANDRTMGPGKAAILREIRGFLAVQSGQATSISVPISDVPI